MEQCGDVVAGLRELDPPAMADDGRREKEGKSRDNGGSGAIYRREESWARGAASGGG